MVNIPVDMALLIKAIQNSGEPADVQKKAIEVAREAFQDDQGYPDIEEPDMPNIKKPDKPIIKDKICELCNQETVTDSDYGQYPCLNCGFVNK